MAKGRLLSRDASTDPDLNRLPLESQLLYLLTLPHLDRDGLITGEPILVWSQAAPLRVGLLDKAPKLIQSWIDANLVTCYEWKDGPILFFPGFRKHNSNLEYKKEPLSKYPPPPGYFRSEYGLIPEDPHQAATLAASFDKKNHYYQALIRYSTPHREPISKTSRTLPEDFSNSSGLREVEVEVEVETSYDDDGEHASRTLPEDFPKDPDDDDDEIISLAHSIALEYLPSWSGDLPFLHSLQRHQLHAAITWLWLYQQYQDSLTDMNHDYHFSRQTPVFASVNNIPGKIVTQARLGNPAPISPQLLPLFQDAIGCAALASDRGALPT